MAKHCKTGSSPTPRLEQPAVTFGKFQHHCGWLLPSWVIQGRPSCPPQLCYTLTSSLIIHPPSLLLQQEFLSQEGCAPRHGKSQLHGVCAENLPLVPLEQGQAACQGQDLWPGWRCHLCCPCARTAALWGDSHCCSSGEEAWQGGTWSGAGNRPWTLVEAGWDVWGSRDVS